MIHLKTFKEFVEHLHVRNEFNKQMDRIHVLSGIAKKQYAIMVTFDTVENEDALLEHETYKQFKKTTNRYVPHPEDPNIPVQAHYHIYPAKGKEELYAVNMDGKAHHKVNRGHIVPKKEAEELISLGVKIPPNRILEAKEYALNESIEGSFLTLFLILDIE